MLRRHYFVAPNGAASAANDAWKVSHDSELVATFGNEEHAIRFAIMRARADVATGERCQVHLRHGRSMMTIWCMEDDQIAYDAQMS